MRLPTLFVAAVLWSLCSAADAVAVTQETLGLTVERLTTPARPGELAELAVEIVYRAGMAQEDYPDFIALEQDLRRWLAAASPMSEEGRGMVAAPWDGLLTDLARRVLTSYPPVAAITLTVTPYPSALRPQTDKRAVIASRDGPAPRLSLQVALRRYGLVHQGPNVIDLVTTVHYGEGLDSGQLPDGEALQQELIDRLDSHPNETDYWETLIKALGASLLERHRAVDAVELQLTVYPTATLTYPHEVSVRLGQSPKKETVADPVPGPTAAVPEVIALADQPWYEAEDRAVARELISPRNSSTESFSIAEILVPVGVTVQSHRHHMEEVYHVLAGEGVVMVEDRTRTVGAGDTVLIPPNAWHNIVNTGTVELQLHVTCIPAWAPEHLIFERGKSHHPFR
ncbi:MAG: cupin domain-containing protein [Pseudomonadota bacterium]